MKKLLLILGMIVFTFSMNLACKNEYTTYPSQGNHCPLLFCVTTHDIWMVRAASHTGDLEQRVFDIDAYNIITF